MTVPLEDPVGSFSGREIGKGSGVGCYTRIGFPVVYRFPSVQSFLGSSNSLFFLPPKATIDFCNVNISFLSS